MPNVHAAEDRPAHRGRPSAHESPAIKSGAAPRCYARIAFTYAEAHLHRGQVFTLIGARNDERLLRLRYIAMLEDRHETYQCAECGCEFVQLYDRTAHTCRGRRRPQSLDPYEEDAHTEAEDKRILGELALDQTAASLR